MTLGRRGGITADEPVQAGRVPFRPVVGQLVVGHEGIGGVGADSAEHAGSLPGA